jgi:hypothetical protein
VIPHAACCMPVDSVHGGTTTSIVHASFINGSSDDLNLACDERRDRLRALVQHATAMHVLWLVHSQ